ncbi:hypothetical protein KVR01_013077 [Diaporthe batatas]|uniref:uncharacterized protein n=1 Tax=Diaporthe batatas TaxID=748121 RepID=UPI001D047BC2|nr:uncharacterized protein KVR01_013077 [Diaporthe batatas]KAG8157087.1 hypothetical protein KVR01_013077 [Diaporthe batatas]
MAATIPTPVNEPYRRNGIPGASGDDGVSSSSIADTASSSHFVMRNKPLHANRHMRVITVGAGASGIYMAWKLKYSFTDFTLNVYEKNPEVSGTWYENRHNYTYSFQPKWDWSANYASSHEIYTYFNDFVDQYKLRPYISLNHEVVGASWEEHTSTWVVKIKNADGVFEQRCDFLINAAGILNNWKWPAIPGLQSYKGTLLHSAAWDDSVDLTGKHVGLIGNGVAKHVTTFIREPTWVAPSLGMDYHEYSDEEKRRFKEDPGVLLAMRKQTELGMAMVFPNFIRGSAAQLATQKYMQSTMESKLQNPDLAQTLIPPFPPGCRRLTPGVDYLESLGKENVTTIYGEITKVTETGCVTEKAGSVDVDVLICATGFNTTFKPRASECITFAQSDVRRFLGPNCPIGNGPIIFSVEIEGEYIAQFLNRWQKEDIASFDPKLEAVNDFMQQKDAFMPSTVWDDNCLSWYKDPRTQKVTALWPGSTLHYMEVLASPRYEDFEVRYASKNRFAYLGNGFSQTELNPHIDKTYYIRERPDDQPLCRNSQSTYNAKDLGDHLDNYLKGVFQ